MVSGVCDKLQHNTQVGIRATEAENSRLIFVGSCLGSRTKERARLTAESFNIDNIGSSRVIEVRDSNDVFPRADDQSAKVHRTDDMIHDPGRGLVENASRHIPSPGEEVTSKAAHDIHAVYATARFVCPTSPSPAEAWTACFYSGSRGGMCVPRSP